MQHKKNDKKTAFFDEFTFISLTFNEAVLRIAAFTLVVMTVSSMYSPVPSLVLVAPQPIRIRLNKLRKHNAYILRVFIFTTPVK